MLKRFVLGTCAVPGVQVKIPLEGLTTAPAGAPGARLKVSTWAGKSKSLTTFVNVSNWLAATVLFPMGERIGAVFTSVTTIVKSWVALRLGTPLSTTRTRILLLLGPCASVGVQAKRPLVGLTVAPVGAETIS